MNKEWEVEFKSKCAFGGCDSCTAQIELVKGILASQRETLAAEIEGLKITNPLGNENGFEVGINRGLTDAAAHIRK
jgi:hypothetical protein